MTFQQVHLLFRAEHFEKGSRTSPHCGSGSAWCDGPRSEVWFHLAVLSHGGCRVIEIRCAWARRCEIWAAVWYASHSTNCICGMCAYALNKGAYDFQCAQKEPLPQYLVTQRRRANGTEAWWRMRAFCKLEKDPVRITMHSWLSACVSWIRAFGQMSRHHTHTNALNPLASSASVGEGLCSHGGASRLLARWPAWCSARVALKMPLLTQVCINGLGE